MAVDAASIALPLLAVARTEFLDGGSTPALASWLAGRTVPLGRVDLETTADFALPGPLS